MSMPEPGAREFQRCFPPEWKWLQDNQARNEFARSLLRHVGMYGTLTGPQIHAVRNNIAKDASPKAPVDTSLLMAAFDLAAKRGVKHPKMRFETFVASLAPSNGKNAGAIYVKGTDDAYLGKIVGGSFVSTGAASPETCAAILTVMADPLAASVAYGRRTGQCSICGRLLENAESIERGIGPICAGNFGL